MGAYRKYTEAVLRDAVAESHSVAGVLRALGLAQAGGTHAHISRTIKRMGIDTSHFKPHGKNGADKRRRSAAEILIRTGRGDGRSKPHLLRRALVDIGRILRCEGCGLSDEWQGRPIRLHVDHVDGDFHNNEAANLRFLCPNCHSQTATFAGLSRGRYTGTYSRVEPGASTS